MVYGIEKARRLHRLINGTGEPANARLLQIGKVAVEPKVESVRKQGG